MENNDSLRYKNYNKDGSVSDTNDAPKETKLMVIHICK